MPRILASSPSQISGVHCSRVLGNLGGSLALKADEKNDGNDYDAEAEEKVELEMYEIQEDSPHP